MYLKSKHTAFMQNKPHVNYQSNWWRAFTPRRRAGSTSSTQTQKDHFPLAEIFLSLSLMKVITALLWIWPLQYELLTEQLEWKWESEHSKVSHKGVSIIFKLRREKKKKVCHWLSNSLTKCQIVQPLNVTNSVGNLPAYQRITLSFLTNGLFRPIRLRLWLNQTNAHRNFSHLSDYFVKVGELWWQRIT